VDWLWRQRVTHVELATPGPMGLIGLLAARLLRLPVTASYHTAIPSLAALLDGQEWLGAAARRLLGWFYRQPDAVFTYSARAQEELIEMGVPRERIQSLPIAVDPSEFTPTLRCPSVFRTLGIEVGDRPVVLSVGRLSKEKNIPIIVEAVRSLQGRDLSPLLLVVGDGPERAALQTHYRDEFVQFLGARTGEVLRRLYASARLFAFASTVDTLGLVNLEAMASGIPVLIPSQASFAEVAEHGISAELYPFGSDGLARAIDRVLGDSDYAAHLGGNARSAMVERWSQAPFAKVWSSFVAR
jgi:glycosyltransferase involved in cell wall biosynthesis